MSSIYWVIALIFNLAVAIFVAVNFWFEPWIMAHVINIGLGIFSLWSRIDTGLRYGWKT